MVTAGNTRPISGTRIEGRRVEIINKEGINAKNTTYEGMFLSH